MKHVFSRAAALFLAAAIFVITVQAVPQISASSHILLDADSGAILSGHEIHKRSLIASTTKIMTALIVLETLDPEQLVTIPKEAVGIEGSSMYLQEGETLTVSELLYGLMLHSGNDAAVALALASCGTVSSFVALMNQKAEELSLNGTHFENPNGLDGEDHYSTAYDLGRLTAYALKLPGFREIVSCKEIRLSNRSLRNHNRLLWMDQGIIGVKTGYTKAAGRILVSAMDYHGRTLIAVTIHDSNDWHDHLSLYDYGKNCYTEQLIIQKGTLLGELPLWNGNRGVLYSNEDISAWVLKHEQPILQIIYPKFPLSQEGTALIDVYMGTLHLGRITADWEELYNGTTAKNHSLPGNLLSAHS